MIQHIYRSAVLILVLLIGWNPSFTIAQDEAQPVSLPGTEVHQFQTEAEMARFSEETTRRSVKIGAAIEAKLGPRPAEPVSPAIACHDTAIQRVLDQGKDPYDDVQKIYDDLVDEYGYEVAGRLVKPEVAPAPAP